MALFAPLDGAVRKWFATNRDRFRGRVLVVPHASGFELESLLGPVAAGCYSNDPLPSGQVLGAVLAGRDPRLELALGDDYADLAPAFEASPGAALLVLAAMVPFERQRNHYEQRMWRGWRLRVKDALAQAEARVDEMRKVVKLTEFSSLPAGEFLERAKEHGPRAVVVGRMPGRVSVVEKRLGELLGLEVPAPTRPEAALALWSSIAEATPCALVSTDEHGDIEEALHRQKGGAACVHVYANLPDVAQGVVGVPLSIEPTDHARLTDADLKDVTPDSDVRFVRVPSPQFDYYRVLYLARGINPTPVKLALFVFIDGKLAGFLGFGTWASGAKLRRYSDEAFMAADFPVDVAKGARLAKLILWLSRTTEVADLLRERLVAQVGAITTTVFSERPTSMKYRGVYDLIGRDERPDGRHTLMYRAPAGTHTIPEAIREWQRSQEKSAPPSTPSTKRSRARASRATGSGSSTPPS